MFIPAPDPSFDPNKDKYDRYVSEHGPIQFQLTMFGDGTVLYSGNKYMSLDLALAMIHDISVQAKLDLEEYREKASEN